jgi:drug/metabolite transporter (DMT)-like permease
MAMTKNPWEMSPARSRRRRGQVGLKISPSILGAHLALLGAAVLFGTTYGMVKWAIEGVDVASFLAMRFLIGAAVLAPIGLFAVDCGRGVTRRVPAAR